MSGSSGGSFGGGFAADLTCEKIRIRTNLASPNPEIIELLNVDDVLYVSLDGPTGPITARTADGDIAGAILVADPVKLINCISDRYVYAAKVLSIAGGDCQVLIYCTGQ